MHGQRTGPVQPALNSIFPGGFTHAFTAPPVGVGTPSLVQLPGFWTQPDFQD